MKVFKKIINTIGFIGAIIFFGVVLSIFVSIGEADGFVNVISTFAGLFIAVIFLSFFAKIYRKSRLKKLRNIMSRYGYQLDKINVDISSFDFFKKENFINCFNIFSLKKYNLNFIIFDYHYIVIFLGGGDNNEKFVTKKELGVAEITHSAILPRRQGKRRYSATAFLVEINKKMPHFLLVKKGFFSRLYFNIFSTEKYINGSSLGLPVKYLLFTENLEEVKKVFTDEVIKFFKKNSIKKDIEVSENHILFYKSPQNNGPDNRIDPDYLDDEMEKISKIVEIFLA